MTANSKEEEKDSIMFDEILNKLSYSNFISIFFLLIEQYIEPKQYLMIIKQNECKQKTFLKKILLDSHFGKDLLVEILWTIKRYDLLKNLGVCHHKYQSKSSFFKKIWKCLYEVCESFDIEKDLEYLKETFPGVAISDEEYLEEFLVAKYNSKKITEPGLSALLTDLNKDYQRSKTWALGEKYLVKQPTIASPCGLAVIINHENFICEENSGPKLDRRKYSSLDVDSLKRLWESFGFEVQTYIDFKQEEILCAFKDLSEKDLSSYDIFVACYMSHGKEGVVFSSDCKPIEITCLIDFMANKCKSLVDKPKLFFIQACQGTQIQCGISNPVFSPLSISNSSFDIQSSFDIYTSDTPKFVDVLVVASTIPGFVSFASNNKNSWFIQALVENMEQFGHKKNFIDVMTKVTNDVSHKRGEYNFQGQPIKNCKQTVETKTTLRKELHLKKLSY